MQQFHVEQFVLSFKFMSTLGKAHLTMLTLTCKLFSVQMVRYHELVESYMIKLFY